jgi:hypothetical protein
MECGNQDFSQQPVVVSRVSRILVPPFTRGRWSDVEAIFRARG